VVPPGTPAPDGLHFAVSEGFFNQVLFTVWRAGLLSLPLPLDADLVGRHFPALRESVTAGTPVWILVEPSMPPVLARSRLTVVDLGITIGIGATPAVRGFADLHLPAGIVMKGTFITLDLDAKRAEATADVTESSLAPVADAELAAFVREVLPPMLAAGTTQIDGVRVPSLR
jgi:hypothetical protein